MRDDTRQLVAIAEGDTESAKVTIRELELSGDLSQEKISKNEKEAARLRERAGNLEVKAQNLSAANRSLGQELSPRLFNDQIRSS